MPSRSNGPEFQATKRWAELTRSAMAFRDGPRVSASESVFWAERRDIQVSVLTGVAAMIETMPLEKAAEAYTKMMSGGARFRMVITMSEDIQP
jgi:hypothetical protein